MVRGRCGHLEAPDGTAAQIFTPGDPRARAPSHLTARVRLPQTTGMPPEELARELARAIAASGASEGRIRVFVRGGTTDPGEFDAAFVAALLAELPSLHGARVEVLHPPVLRVCSGCGQFFESVEHDADCPYCGGEPFPAWMEERIAYELC